MSYRDLYTGVGVANRGCNGRPAAATGAKSIGCTPFERVAWAMLELAIDDTKLLCRYGLITRSGDLRQWPMVARYESPNHREPMIIANMRDPNDHARLREFWLDETQAQLWCDLCGCRLPAKDIWKSILENHAK